MNVAVTMVAVHSFTAEYHYKALQLAQNLESSIVDIDSNIQQTLKFPQDLKRYCSKCKEIYEN